METDGSSALAMVPTEARLFGKMAQVMGIVNRVPKSGNNTFHKYRYATADDVADTIREAMAEVNLALIVRMGDVDQQTIEYESSQKTTKTIRTTIKFNFIFACGDTGAVISSPWVAQVDDNSDKAINKCATSAEKYFLMKTFIVSAGDEPDADADKHREEPGRRVTPQPAQYPKYARECFEVKEYREQFASLRAKLSITDDKPYLAALGKQLDREPLERYSDYPGKFTELISNMEAIHERLNQPKPDAAAQHWTQDGGMIDLIDILINEDILPKGATVEALKDLVMLDDFGHFEKPADVLDMARDKYQKNQPKPANVPTADEATKLLNHQPGRIDTKATLGIGDARRVPTDEEIDGVFDRAQPQ